MNPVPQIEAGCGEVSINLSSTETFADGTCALLARLWCSL